MGIAIKSVGNSVERHGGKHHYLCGTIICLNFYVLLFVSHVTAHYCFKCHYDQILDTRFFTFSNTKGVS